MTAIYKRELKSYLTSMVGYLFIFFILVLTGIYFSAYQLSAAYPKFEYTLSASTDFDYACTCRGKKTENRAAASDSTGFCERYCNR